MVVSKRLGFFFGFSLVCAFAACGGSSDGDDEGVGNDGTGCTAPNTCPPTLVNYGSGPGIMDRAGLS